MGVGVRRSRIINSRIRDTRSLLESMVTLARKNELPFLAGGIAFFAFFSLIPTLILVVTVGSFLGGEQFAMRAVALVEAFLSEEGSAVITEALSDQSGAATASIVGVLALLWSTLKVFRAVDVAFDRIYGAEAVVSFARRMVNAAVVLVSIGSGLMLLFTLQLAITRLLPDSATYASLIGAPVLLLALLIVLTPLYYVMPPVPVGLREIVPGTLVATVGLTVLQQVFHVYASLAGEFELYGFIGAVLLFLLWLYFGSLVLLFGTVVNVALAEHRGAVDPR